MTAVLGFGDFAVRTSPFQCGFDALELHRDLRALDGCELPPFTAGAHVDLTLPNGLIRSYSLTNPQSDRHRYVIGVAKDRATRGGSKWVHENLRPGMVLTVNGPRNNFALHEAAEKSIFIAGGIGITPIMSMLRTFADRGERRPLVLAYGCSRWEDVLFREEIDRLTRRIEEDNAHWWYETRTDADDGFVDESFRCSLTPPFSISVWSTSHNTRAGLGEAGTGSSCQRCAGGGEEW